MVVWLLTSLLLIWNPSYAAKVRNLRQYEGSAEECAKRYADFPLFGEALDEAQLMRATQRLYANTSGRLATRFELQTFLDSGWSELSQIAQARGQTVAELIRETNEGFQLLSLTQGNEIIRRFHTEAPKMQNYFTWLEKRLAQGPLPPLEKMKPEELAALSNVYRYFQGLAVGTGAAELELFKQTTLNPLFAVDARQIRHLFKTLDEYGEEGVLRIVIQMEERRKAQILAAQERFAQSRPQPTQPVAQPEVPNAVQPVDAPQANPWVVAPTIPPGTRTAEPRPLADLLQKEAPWIEGQVYQFRNPANEDFTVHFAKDVGKEFDREKKRVIQRLLGSLYVGTRGKTGIKMLPETGKDIVEVKAVMGGPHYRLIGCLKGRELTIKKLIDIKETLAAYARQIPSNLCAD